VDGQKASAKKDRTRRLDLFRAFAHEGDADGRNANCFNGALNPELLKPVSRTNLTLLLNAAV